MCLDEDKEDDLFVKSLKEDFNSLWIENADALSLSYTCTNSLKTDFTQFGIRT